MTGYFTRKREKGSSERKVINYRRQISLLVLKKGIRRTEFAYPQIFMRAEANPQPE